MAVSSHLGWRQGETIEEGGATESRAILRSLEQTSGGTLEPGLSSSDGGSMMGLKRSSRIFLGGDMLTLGFWKGLKGLS